MPLHRAATRQPHGNRPAIAGMGGAVPMQSAQQSLTNTGASSNKSCDECGAAVGRPLIRIQFLSSPLLTPANLMWQQAQVRASRASPSRRIL